MAFRESLECVEALNRFGWLIATERQDRAKNALPRLCICGSGNRFSRLAFEPFAELLPFPSEIQLAFAQGGGTFPAVGLG